MTIDEIAVLSVLIGSIVVSIWLGFLHASFDYFSRCSSTDHGGGKRRAGTRGRLEPIKRSPGRCSEASDAPLAHRKPAVGNL